MLTHSRASAIETDCICNGMKMAGAGVWGLPGTEVPQVLKRVTAGADVES